MQFLLILSAQIDNFLFVTIYSLDFFAHSWYINENSS